MSETFLSREEIVELTGAKLKAGQIRVLQQNGLRHYLNAAGWPVVPRSALDGLPPAADREQTWVPNKARRAA